MKAYNFCMAGEKVGYYLESDEDGVLYSRTRFSMGDFVVLAEFWIRHDRGQVTAYRFDDKAWMDLDAGANTFPTSALPLQVRGVLDGDTVEFQSFNEGAGKVTGPASLIREGDTIREIVNGDLVRSVIMDDKGVFQYDWGGGATSTRVASVEAAMDGFEDEG